MERGEHWQLKGADYLEREDYQFNIGPYGAGIREDQGSSHAWDIGPWTQVKGLVSEPFCTEPTDTTW